MLPHSGLPVFTAGTPLGESRAAVIMIHGRGASPEDILGLVPHLDRPALTYLAPSAANDVWYPFTFLAEIARNEPDLSSALAAIDALVEQVEARAIPRERIVLLGFSQGACLACEFVARHPARWGGVVALSGGLIGPPGTQWMAQGDLAGTPVFIGCSDIDPHIPKARVDESAAVLTGMGGDVTLRIYPGMGHLVVEDEIEYARRILDGVR